MGYAQVDNHEPEVISESVGDEEPLAGQVLKPNLRLRLIVFALVDQSEASVLALLVDFKSENFSATQNRVKSTNESIWRLIKLL